MRNLFTELVLGDNNKNGFDGKLTIEIGDLKVTHSYSSSDDINKDNVHNHTTSETVELQNLKMNGDVSATMSGLFKIMAELGEQVRTTVKNKVDDGYAATPCKPDVTVEVE